ncbi:MAG: hypothetical protein ACI4QC_01405 [Thermoguttaceae bacterium]
MRTSRREFISCLGAGFAATLASPSLLASDFKEPSFPLFRPGEYKRINSATRQFHLSVTLSDVLAEGLVEHEHPMPKNLNAIEMKAANMAELWKEAGVTDIWLAPYGPGVYTDQKTMDAAIRRAMDFGYRVHFINVPIGHPNSKLAPEVEARWKPCKRYDGSESWGVSVHSETAKDCVTAVRRLADKYGPCDLFFDDDYRFAISPADIGGCVCDECRTAFMAKSGFSEERLNETIADVRANKDTKDVRAWIDYFCDILTKTFHDSRDIAPEVDLGIMVMGMGSEKAGIRLEDYRGALFRVGEWMFTNAQYDSTKNKTIELYSSLFHRRFVEPERAFSETTIIQELSAENYVSKLSISTLSDVRNTMFMCPIPASYWKLITPRMKKEKEYHSRIYGAKAKGPFKHFWGMADRYMASYDAYSLFLACGVPFEVCDELPGDGFAFLGDASAREMERGELTSPGAMCVARFESVNNRFAAVPETFEEIFKFRKTLLPKFKSEGIPYVEEETPVVLGWYPDAKAAYLWNVDNADKVVTLRKGERTVAVNLKALDSAMVIEGGDGEFRVI